MTGKRIRRRWVSVGVGLLLALLAVVGPVIGVLAGRPIGNWFVIGTDSLPPRVDQVHPSIAYNPEIQEYLVVWHNMRENYPDIRAQRVGAKGQLIDEPFYIASGEVVEHLYPDVVYNSIQHEYLVVWEKTPGGGGRPSVWAQRVGMEGGLVGGAFSVSEGPELANNYRPAVSWASTSNLYMVVWQRHVQGNLSSDIEAQALTSTGSQWWGGNFVIAEGGSPISHADPDIGYNRSRNEYLVVWTRTDNTPYTGIRGRIITRDGELLYSELEIGNHATDELHASVTGKPTEPNFGGYYVAWELKHPASKGSIYGREVGWDGLLAQYDPIWDYIDKSTDPSVAYNEESGQYYVAWSHAIDLAQDMWDIYGLPLVPGSPMPWRDSFAHGESTAKQPALAPGPLGDFLVAWSDAPRVADRDVFGRVWGGLTYVYLPIVIR